MVRMCIAHQAMRLPARHRRLASTLLGVSAMGAGVDWLLPVALCVWLRLQRRCGEGPRVYEGMCVVFGRTIS